jgi:membrane protease YdiL (CAAX protease family)
MTSAPSLASPPVTAVARHSAGRSVLLHLGPAVPAMAVYVALAPVAHRLGLPTIAALALSGLLGVAPVQLGLLALHRRRHPAQRVNLLQGRVGAPRLLLLVVLEVVLAAAAFALTAPVGPLLRAAVFGWWPDAWVLDGGTHPGFSRQALVLTAVLVLLRSVVVAPVVEERYFRGYLLPRMPERLGRVTPLAHVLLFAGYHLWTPWLAPTRVLAIWPLAHIAHRTRDLRIGVVAHVLVNAVDLALLAHFILLA